jgi:site-specific DNA-methyltransferase (adenine-specific)
MPKFRLVIDRSVVELAALRNEPIEIDLVLKDDGHDGPSLRGSPPRGPLAGLMANGLIEAGDRLVFTQRRANRSATATIRPDGGLELSGRSDVFWSPSKAATAVTGSQVNGWTLWRKESDGRTLDELRSLCTNTDSSQHP